MKIDHHIFDANGYYKDTKKIESAIKRAEDFCNKNLDPNENINLIVSSYPEYLTPEDGVGGRCMWSDLVFFSIDPQADVSEDVIFEMLVHELCHAVRIQKNPEWITTLLDNCINEGISTIFEEQAGKYTHFIKTISSRNSEENEKLFEALKPQLLSQNYNYNEIFYNGNDSLPRWAGYSVGYHIIKQYMAQKNLTIKQLLPIEFKEYKKFIKKIKGAE